MAWLVLIISAVLEAVWATALGETDHFTNLTATAVFLVALVLSMVGLARAAKSIAIGTAYAIWTGLGAALTVGYAIVTGEESVSAAKVMCLAGIIVAVIGLKLLPARAPGNRTGSTACDAPHSGGTRPT
jgi:quaternary ammonium compound-resistance protein SugE